MKIEINMKDWELLDYCLGYTFKYYMGLANLEAVKKASEINKLRNKIMINSKFLTTDSDGKVKRPK